MPSEKQLIQSIEKLKAKIAKQEAEMRAKIGDEKTDEILEEIRNEEFNADVHDLYYEFIKIGATYNVTFETIFGMVKDLHDQA